VGELVVATTERLSQGDLVAIRELMQDAFGTSFTDDDWAHSIGGLHVLVRADGSILSHGSVVARSLLAGRRRLSTGYVEAVATRPDVWRRGLAGRVMRELADHIGAEYELGALSTDVPDLYGGLGWEIWRGLTFVATPGGRLRTADEDGGVMVLRSAATGDLDLDDELTCDWREGDVW